MEWEFYKDFHATTTHKHTIDNGEHLEFDKQFVFFDSNPVLLQSAKRLSKWSNTSDLKVWQWTHTNDKNKNVSNAQKYVELMISVAINIQTYTISSIDHFLYKQTLHLHQMDLAVSQTIDN